MQLLCEFAADVEVRDESANTPLLVACSQGHYDCVKFLLQSAADLSVVNANGDSALHLAAWDGSPDCIEILAEYGVDPLARNGFGLSPLANLKTRSPMRHKFDDLVADHPMRRTLVLLEELEQEAIATERDDGDDGDEREGAGGAAINHKSPEQQRASPMSNTEQLKRVTFDTNQSSANQTTDVRTKSNSASRATASWKVRLRCCPCAGSLRGSKLASELLSSQRIRGPHACDVMYGWSGLVVWLWQQQQTTAATARTRSARGGDASTV